MAMKTSPQAVWVAYDGGNPPAHAGPDDLATGTDVINTRGTGTVSQQHRSTGATATVTLPEGQTYKAAAGAPHILRAAADGTTRDLPVTGLPFGAELTGTVVTGGSVRRAAVVHRLDGTARTGLVDLADGTLGVSLPGSTTVLTVPPNRAHIDGLMLSGGTLLMRGTPPPSAATTRCTPCRWVRRASPGPHTPRASVLNVSPCLAGDAACPQVEALGDGRFAYLSTDPATAATGDAKGRIGTGTGRYVLYSGGTPGVQKVADFRRGADGEIVLSRPRTAAAMWGRRLWMPGSTQGTVVAHDLATSPT
ncbi:MULTISPECIES: hypothetical protein [Streptomyces]|uniref:Uncharacterized protein n=2 Tax=Streptomyces TaxID=1883 RepID=A0A2U9P7H6_STRAS|nr:hypothetical protein [Streptomyces actuosus]AWT45700.1 hypothetical protein DMT42_27690 [Streptomyces actuosus]MBM4822333.1 hypothetical protein [Streptomyces actuosus]